MAEVRYKVPDEVFKDLLMTKPKHMKRHEWARHLMAEHLAQRIKLKKREEGSAEVSPLSLASVLYGCMPRYLCSTNSQEDFIVTYG